MKKIILSFFIIIIKYFAIAQCNLVPNPDFENFTGCPTAQSQIDSAAPWTLITGSSDYFNRCSSNFMCDVPTNFAGVQQPRSGDGYVGLFTYYSPTNPSLKEYKEHIKTQLLEPLKVGETYLVSFWYSLSDNSRFGVDGLGALFSNGVENTVLIGSAPFYISDRPQVITTKGIPLTDKGNWVPFSASFVATQAYSHIIIGGFYLSDSTTVTNLIPNSNQNDAYAYYYIDDVSVTCSSCLNLGKDTTLCSDETMILEATDNNSTYLWQDNSTNSSYTVYQPGTYWVIKSNNINNCVDRDTINVLYKYPPIFDLGSNDILCENQSVILNALCDGCSYLWQDGSTSSNYITSSIQNNYFATATNSCGTFTDSVTYSYRNCESVLYIPNSFTPDGDGMNDFFFINSPLELSSFSIHVFNRWGEEVYVSNSQNEGWNGIFKNQKTPAGVYVWKVSYSTSQDPVAIKTLVGSVVLIY